MSRGDHESVSYSGGCAGVNVHQESRIFVSLTATCEVVPVPPHLRDALLALHRPHPAVPPLLLLVPDLLRVLLYAPPRVLPPLPRQEHDVLPPRARVTLGLISVVRRRVGGGDTTWCVRAPMPDTTMCDRHTFQPLHTTVTADPLDGIFVVTRQQQNIVQRNDTEQETAGGRGARPAAVLAPHRTRTPPGRPADGRRPRHVPPTPTASGASSAHPHAAAGATTSATVRRRARGSDGGRQRPAASPDSSKK
eukprot:CAMPEP_0171297694 /NCGR_PEP_ID=MMETSP0816-20121228/6445_1 /TAXON_ID=420281 /ORGANISM="Proboscia inermis, Strain CCAP1064/1" /LENGTH=249 /DNA_ID=CAMNT_0011772163 /DNA_START=164 /DNA_END=911 /DNA_ORIENTATION=+